ncbi:MAG: diaminopimelate epimerase [Veillonellaceae bacterium]|nr:diaminopimelate epimerase [Veillonellaceae bacterium]
MRFTKWHGLGNDFILVDMKEAAVDPSLAAALCDRRRGIGADGLVLLAPTAEADVRMVIYNADGSVAQMCGNAARCVARYWRERYLPTATRLTIATDSGSVTAEFLAGEGEPLVRVRMAVPGLRRGDVGIVTDPDGDALALQVAVGGAEREFTGVSLGNPHAVTFVADAEAVPLADWGPQAETAEMFTEKTNVEFAQILDRRTIRMRVWERGVGITQACGTGACATAVAAIRRGLTERETEVRLDGGSLRIAWAGEGEPVYMTGPATEVFAGVYGEATE